MGVKLIIKAVIKRQSQKIPVLLGRGEIFRLPCLIIRQSNGRRAN